MKSKKSLSKKLTMITAICLASNLYSTKAQAVEIPVPLQGVENNFVIEESITGKNYYSTYEANSKTYGILLKNPDGSLTDSYSDFIDNTILSVTPTITDTTNPSYYSGITKAADPSQADFTINVNGTILGYDVVGADKNTPIGTSILEPSDYVGDINSNYLFYTSDSRFVEVQASPNLKDINVDLIGSTMTSTGGNSFNNMILLSTIGRYTDSTGQIIYLDDVNFTGNFIGNTSGNSLFWLTNSGLTNLKGNFLYNNASVIKIENSHIKNIEGNFIGNIVTSNSSAGGALYFQAGTVEMINSNFIDNSSGTGGAIALNRQTVNNINSNFINNSATTSNLGAGGGAIATDIHSTINTLTGNFINNTANSGGGAICTWGKIGTLTSTFLNNSATDGGAIYSYGNSSGYGISTLNGTFIDNTASSRGGAIFNLVSTINSLSGVFINNNAGIDGGAIYNSGNLTITTNGSDTIFNGNTTGANKEISNALHTGRYNSFYTGTTNLMANGEHKIIFNDGITGEEITTLNIGGIDHLNKANPTLLHTGTVVLNADVSGTLGTTNFGGGTIVVGADMGTTIISSSTPTSVVYDTLLEADKYTNFFAGDFITTNETITRAPNYLLLDTANGVLDRFNTSAWNTTANILNTKIDIDMSLSDVVNGEQFFGADFFDNMVDPTATLNDGQYINITHLNILNPIDVTPDVRVPVTSDGTNFTIDSSALIAQGITPTTVYTYNFSDEELKSHGDLIIKSIATTVNPEIQGPSVGRDGFVNVLVDVTRRVLGKPSTDSFNPPMMVSDSTPIAWVESGKELIPVGKEMMVQGKEISVNSIENNSNENAIALNSSNNSKLASTHINEKNSEETEYTFEVADEYKVPNNVWVDIYTFDEDLKYDGLTVDNNVYAGIVGYDFDPTMHGNWNALYSIYGAYINAEQKYLGVNNFGLSTDQQGVALGLIGTYNKDNVYISVTGNIGLSMADNNTSYGTDDLDMYSLSLGSKIWTEIDFNDDRFTLEPGIYLGYHYIYMGDYTTSSNVRIDSDGLSTFTLSPELKLNMNTESGYRPYISASYIMSHEQGGEITADSTLLPSLGTESYGEFKLGVSKEFNQDLSAYIEGIAHKGDRDGYGVQLGFEWKI